MGFFKKCYNDRTGKETWNITTVVIPQVKEEVENKTIYVVCGEFPNIHIDKKEIVSEDEFNYCLKESLTNNIGIWEKSKCFNDFESAVNEVIKQLQAEYVKKVLPTKKK